jgi:hypothetical protein
MDCADRLAVRSPLTRKLAHPDTTAPRLSGSDTGFGFWLPRPGLDLVRSGGMSDALRGHRFGLAARVRGRDVAELLLQDRSHQDRTVTPYGEIVRRVVPRKGGDRGELRPAVRLAELRSWWRGHRVAHLCSLARGTRFARQEFRSGGPEVFPYGGVRSGCDRGGAAGAGDQAGRGGGPGSAGAWDCGRSPSLPSPPSPLPP